MPPDAYSYLDVLTAAVAQSGIHSFTSDTMRWSTAVRRMRDRHPDLLAGVWFTERGYSEQVADFLGVMARADAFTFTGPRHERIEVASGVAVPETLDGYMNAVRDLALILASLRLAY